MLTVPYRAPRAASGPVTFGQRDTLLWVQGGGNDAAAVLFRRLPLPSGARLADVALAWSMLLARHEALRTRFTRVDGEPVQVVDGSGELPVDVLDVDAGASVAAVEDTLVAHLRDQGVDIEAGPVLRAAVGSCDGVPRAAVAICSHAATDLAGLAVVGRQFTELVAAAVAGRPVDPGPPGYQPLDQAAFEHTAQARRRGDAAVRYWAERLRTAPQAMFPMPPPDVPVAEHRSAFLRSRAAAIALRYLTSRAGVAAQSAVLAAVCTVLSVRTGMDRCVFSVLSGNRFRERLHSYVGALAQDGLVAFDIAGATFDDVARRAAAATLAANTHASYDIVALRAARDAIARERGVVFERDFSFNNLSGLLGDAPDSSPGELADLDAALAETTVTWLKVERFAEMLMCHPVSFGPELVIAMTGDLRHVPESELSGLLHGVERLLVASATGPVPLADVGRVSGVTPVPRGPDWVLVDSCWVSLAAVRELVAEAVGASITPALVAHVPATIEVRTAAAAHAACLAALPGRRNAMTPARYVVYEDGAVIDEGSGR